jgi:hypothetical protein
MIVEPKETELICSRCNEAVNLCSYCDFVFGPNYTLICFQNKHYCIDTHLVKDLVGSKPTTISVPKVSLEDKIKEEMMISQDPNMILALDILNEIIKENPDKEHWKKEVKFLDRKQLEKWVYNRILFYKKELRSDELR